VPFTTARGVGVWLGVREPLLVPDPLRVTVAVIERVPLPVSDGDSDSDRVTDCDGVPDAVTLIDCDGDLEPVPVDEGVAPCEADTVIDCDCEGVRVSVAVPEREGVGV
jgi:hypothetical protein